MKKIDKVLKIVQILSENPNIRPKELASLLKVNLRTAYRYIKQYKKIKILANLQDEVVHLTTVFSRPELALIHKLVESKLPSVKNWTIKRSE